MTTVTIYSDTADGYIYSSSTSYTTASNGNFLNVSSSEPIGFLGQYPNSGSYYIYQTFLKFDTSSIPDDAQITSVTLSCYGYTGSPPTSFSIEARLHDWDTTLTTADWVAGSNLSSKALLATINSSGWSTSGYNALTENGNNLKNNINKTGTTYIILCSGEQTNGSPPTNDEYVGLYYTDETGTSKDPKLEITYSTTYTQSTSGTTGTLTGVLSAGHVYTQAIAGAISSITSTLTRVANKAVAGSITPDGVVSKLTTKSFSGAIGAVSGAVTTVDVILHEISGTMGALSGTVSSLQTGFGMALAGSIENLSGSISRVINKSLAGALTPSAILYRANTFRFAFMKAGSVVKKVIQGGRDE